MGRVLHSWSQRWDDVGWAPGLSVRAFTLGLSVRRCLGMAAGSEFG